MRLYLFTLVLFLFSAGAYAQNRAVAVVYDNSGSMQQAGQCEGINYALQLMVGLLHPQDELSVFKMEPPVGTDINLNQKKSSIAAITQSYDCSARKTPFAALTTASNKLAASNKKFKWLIVLSDGDITDTNFEQAAGSNIRNFVETTGGRVIFLNVNTIESKLDRYLDNSNTPNNTLRTQGNFDQIIKTMEEIAGNVMTLSKGGVKAQAQGTKITINTPVPLKKMIVLAQDARKNAELPNLIKANLNGTSLFIEEPYKAQKLKSTDYQMTGIVTHVKSGKGEGVIPKGELTLLFDKSVDVSKIKFLPEVAAKLDVQIKGSFKAETGNTYTVCDTVKNITIVAKLLDLNNKPLDEAVLKGSKVSFVDENTKKTIALRYNPSSADFSASIPLNSKRITVSASAEYQGYFNYQSSIFVVQKEFCPTPTAFIEASKKTLHAKVTDMQHAETITVIPKIKVGDLPPRAATPEELKDLYFEKLNDTNIGIDVTETDGKMIIRPSTFICACFTKTGTDKLTLALKSKNKNITVDANNKIDIQVTIDDDSFWAKCGTIILTTLIILFLLWYLFGIYKKPRFCKGAEVVYTKTTPLVERKPKSYLLPNGFVKRYLIPYTPEKQVVGGIEFKAGSRCSHVFIDRNSQNERMFISGMPIDKPRDKDVRLSNSEKLEITGQGNSKETYEYRKI